MKQIIMILLLLGISTTSIENNKPKIYSEDKDVNLGLTNKECKLIISNFIKQHEGLKLKTYKYVGNHKTIGYGHILKKGEYFNNITIKQADSLLESDMAGAERMYNFYFPDSITSHLNNNQQWVIKHLIYAKGIGGVTKKILPLIKQKKSIDSVVLNWNYYFKNGTKIKSKYSTRIRQSEMNFWYNKQIEF